MNQKLFEDLSKSIKEAGKIQRGEVRASRQFTYSIKPIPDFPGYTIDTNGNVYHKRLGRLLKQQTVMGYKRVGLYKNSRTRWKLVHRLILEAFVKPCPKGKEACHNNGIRNDNRLENLRWGTRSENIIDAIKHGTHNCVLKMRLTEKDVINIIHLWNTKLFRQREIANMYNVGQDSISRIVNGKRWKHIWQK